MADLDDLKKEVAVLASDVRNHIASDEKFQQTIGKTLDDIKNLLRTSIDKQERAVERLHTRIDGEREYGQKERKRIEDMVGDQKTKALAGVITGLVAVIAAGWALLQGFVSGGNHGG